MLSKSTVSSKNLQVADWPGKVLDQERRELEKLEQILQKEVQKAAKRQALLTELE